MKEYLLNHINVDTDGTPVTGTGAARIVQITGTDFGGGSVALEMTAGTDQPFTILQYRGAPSAFVINTNVSLNFFPRGYLLRAVLAGATNPIDVTVTISDS